MATLYQDVVDPQREGDDPACGWCRWWNAAESDPDRGICRHPTDPQEDATMYFNGCDLWHASAGRRESSLSGVSDAQPRIEPVRRIERIRIRGFRSLANVEFRPPTGACVLIGANGSGKSKRSCTGLSGTM